MIFVVFKFISSSLVHRERSPRHEVRGSTAKWEIIICEVEVMGHVSMDVEIKSLACTLETVAEIREGR